MKKDAFTFSKDMTVGEVVSLFPGAADILMGYGLHCVGCHANAFETVEQGVLGHGYTMEEVEELIEDLNEAWQDSQDDASPKTLHKESENMEISITDFALEKIQSIAELENKAGYPLRVAARKVGPQLKYSLDFVEPQSTSATDKGFSFQNGKVNVVIDKNLYSDLNGLEIDYIEEDHRAGFKMNNPNIKA